LSIFTFVHTYVVTFLKISFYWLTIKVLYSIFLTKDLEINKNKYWIKMYL